MWQRFTENSRRVVFYAQEEASKAGAKVVEPEHLLLALLRDERSFAARVTQSLVFDLDLVRAEARVASHIPSAAAPVALQPADSLLRAIDLALAEARTQNCACIAPEHLLVGLVCSEDNGAVRALARYGVDADRTRTAIAKLRPQQFVDNKLTASLSIGIAGTARPAARFTDRARKILVEARAESRRFRAAFVEPEHLLLALVNDEYTVAIRLLDRLGIPLQRVRAEIQRQIVEAGLQVSAEAAVPARSRLELFGVNLDAIQAGIQRQVTLAKGSAIGELELARPSKTAIDLASDEADALAHNFIGTEHLLLGLIREEHGLAARALLLSGVEIDRARDAIVAMQSEARTKLLADDAHAIYPTRSDIARSHGDSEVDLANATMASCREKEHNSNARPGDLGVVRAESSRNVVEVSPDLATFRQLVRIFAAKDSHGYVELVGKDNGAFLIEGGTRVKRLQPEDDASENDGSACFVRVLSGEREGRAGWIALHAFVRIGPDDGIFPPGL